MNDTEEKKHDEVKHQDSYCCNRDKETYFDRLKYLVLVEKYIDS